MSIKETAKEVIFAVIPIAIIITVLNFIIIKLPVEEFLDFIGGTVLIAVGLILFLTGVNIGLLPLGEMIGSKLISKGKLSLTVFITFIMGFVITFADPDVQVMAMQVDQVTGGTVSKLIIISAISLGMGIFLAFAILRIFLKIKYINLLMIGYLIIIVLSFFSSPDYLAVAYDSGGVTTGPLTVPFFMSFGIGITAVIGGKGKENDSFGLLAMACIGPIISMLILGIIMK